MKITLNIKRAKGLPEILGTGKPGGASTRLRNTRSVTKYKFSTFGRSSGSTLEEKKEKAEVSRRMRSRWSGGTGAQTKQLTSNDRGTKNTARKTGDEWQREQGTGIGGLGPFEKGGGPITRGKRKRDVKTLRP